MSCRPLGGGLICGDDPPPRPRPAPCPSCGLVQRTRAAAAICRDPVHDDQRTD